MSDANNIEISIKFEDANAAVKGSIKIPEFKARTE